MFTLILHSELINVDTKNVNERLTGGRCVFETSSSRLKAVLTRLNVTRAMNLVIFPRRIDVSHGTSRVSRTVLRMVGCDRFTRQIGD